MTLPDPLVSSSKRNSSPSSSSSGLLQGLLALEAGVAWEAEGEGEQEEEEEEEEEVPVLSGCPRYQKILMEYEEETSAWRQPHPPPGGRNPPSHWPGRCCPSHASPRPIEWEQRGEVEGLVADRLVTELMGDHGEGCGDDNEGGSSLQENRRSFRGQRSEDEGAGEKLRKITE